MLKKIINICLIVCLLIANFYIPEFKVRAKTLGDLKKELAQFEEDYKNNQLQQELTQEEILNIESKITNITDNIIKLGKEIANLNSEIDKLNEEIEQKKSEIESILSFVQISSGESAYLEYAFGAKDFTDFIYRVAVSEQLTSYNDELVEQYKKNIEDNEKKKEELNTKKKDLAKQQSSLRVELDKVKESLQELDEFSLSIDEQIEAKKSEIKIYEDKGCKDNEDIKTCGMAMLPPDTSFYRPLVSGWLTGWFGQRDCSDPRISCYHHGLDMTASGSSYGNVPVYSAANGVVVYIATPTYNSSTGRYNTKCGGKQVFIQHNINGVIYTTGYLHLRSINVEKGQVVTKETQIGVMGGNPNIEYWDNCSTGAHLHFEISTGTFNEGNYYANRLPANTYVNFPKSLLKDWYDRKVKF